MGPLRPAEVPQRAGRSTGGGAHVLGRALSLCTKPRALPCYPQLALTPVPVTDSKDRKEGLEGKKDIHTMWINETHTWYETGWFQ